jgi:predicted dehydrogenase
MSGPFGLLLIAGNQTHQENYARAFAADPRCRLIGLTDEPGIPDRRRELNQDLAQELGIPYLVSFDAAIHRPDVDFISICAEPERRVPLTQACAEAGKHLYLDKDPAPTPAGCRQILAAVQSAGVLTQSFSLVRLNSCRTARQILTSGRIGDLAGLHCDITFAKGFAGSADLRQVRAEKPDPTRFTFFDSKREFLCVGWYPLILFQWLTGRRFVEVSAITSNWFFAEHQKNDVEDFATVLLTMEGGLECSIAAGRCGWTSHRSWGLHDLRLTGTRDTVLLDAHQPRLEICGAAAPWVPPAAPHPEDPMGFWTSTQNASGVKPKQDWSVVEPVAQSDASAFLDCLERGQPSDVPIGMAVHAVDVIHAVYRSAAQGRPVALPPD